MARGSNNRTSTRLVGLCCCLLLLAALLAATGILHAEGLTALALLVVPWGARATCSSPESEFSRRYGQCPARRQRALNSSGRPTVYWPSAAQRFAAEGYNSSAGLYRDFFERGLLRELFPPSKFLHLHRLPESTGRSPSVLVCNSFSDTYLIKSQLFCNCSSRLLVHLSDERLQGAYRSKGSCETLYHRFDLVLRQYHSPRLARRHAGSRTALLQLPLGVFPRGDYANSADMARAAAAVDSRHRPFKWAHVGTVKADRYIAYKTFRSWQPHYYNVSLLVPPQRVADAYRSSLFVLAGRGNANVDVIRVYEAIACGAVPVVVASAKEVAAAFAFGGSVPPLLHAPSWDAALLACADASFDDIDRMRARLALWYAQLMSRLRNRIDRLLIDS